MSAFEWKREARPDQGGAKRRSYVMSPLPGQVRVSFCETAALASLRAFA